MPRKNTSFLRGKIRGLTLLEALLSLAVGGAMVAGSMYGVKQYSDGVKVQSTAVMLQRLTTAAEEYGNLNYATLLANAPQELPITVLEPFYGPNIGQDAFRSQYSISTRTYPVTVPDYVNGGTKTINAVQMLVLGGKDLNSQLDADLALRAQVANTAGTTAGFIAQGLATCEDAAGNALPDGSVCGSFGSFSMPAANFPASTLTNFAYGGLVTIGDSSVYGDQLYRYDLGDPELNTMHTDLLMGNNDIVDPDAITGVDRIEFSGPNQTISSATGRINIEPNIGLRLAPRNHRIVLGDASGADTQVPVIVGERGRVQIGEGGDTLRLGELIDDNHGGHTRQIATGDLQANDTFSQRTFTNEIRSLHAGAGGVTDPLRIQKVNSGSAIIGKRVRYNPTAGGASGTYEVADGSLVAGEVRVRDVKCADCGGNLSEILPRWRHMGTYYVRDNVAFPNGTRVPKPLCNLNKRDNINLGAQGDEAAWQETGQDERYQARIILTPKHIMFNPGASDGRVSPTAGTLSFHFYATDEPDHWIAKPEVTSEIPSSVNGGVADALAMTYCVFTGGDQNPNSNSLPDMYTPGAYGGSWTRLD